MKDYTPFKENGKVEAAAPEPYPPLEVEGPNPQYARLLGIDMAGGRGEMTSITQYLYHSWTLPDFDNAAPTLRQIAQVEMHHLDMLGVLIEKAARQGIDLPYSKYTYHAIKALEEKNDGKFDYQ